MSRLIIFLATNFAIMIVLSISLRLLGFETYLTQQGLDFNALLVYAAVFGFGGSFLSLAMSKWTAKRFTGAVVIEQPENQTEEWLVSTVRGFAEQENIGMPEVAIYDSPEPNAFATGMSRNSALVAVSTGLLNSMNRKEVEAVLAHEVSHVSNGDMVTLALIQGVVNTFVIFLSRVVGQIVDRVVFKNEEGQGPAFWITTFIAELVIGVLASVIVFWFSRQREFRADAGAARLSGAGNMVAALKSLQANMGESQLPKQISAFGISGGTNGLMGLFRSHPPIEDRIAALRNQRQ